MCYYYVEAKAQIAAATVCTLFYLNTIAEIQVLSSSQFSYCGVLKVVFPTPKRYRHRESHPRESHSVPAFLQRFLAKGGVS